MPKLTKLHDKHRLRYKIYLPDGTYKERSRLYNTQPEARAKETEATTLEVLTSQLNYTQKDLVKWTHAGLLSSKDLEILGENLPGHGKTLEEVLKEWETTWRCGEQESQIRFYRMKNILKILGDNPIKNLTYQHGRNLINELKERDLKIATIRKYLQDLKSALNHQVAIRYLDYNPFATLTAGRIPAEEKIKHTILTDEQIQQVIEKAEQKDQTDTPALNRTLTLHLLLFFGTGIRRKEAQAAKLEHINWQERSITLPDTITKTGKERTIGLGTKLYNKLLTRKGQTGHILPRFAPWSVSRAVTRHLKNCGIKARLHDARHTYTSMLQDTGVQPKDAIKRTGHTNMRMLSHYSHGDFKEVYEDKFDFLKDNKNEDLDK